MFFRDLHIDLPVQRLRRYQVISAISELKRLCPRATLTVGLSNLSAAFGRGKLREALHSTFLQHAIPKGAMASGPDGYGKGHKPTIQKIGFKSKQKRPHMFITCLLTTSCVLHVFCINDHWQCFVRGVWVSNSPGPEPSNRDMEVFNTGYCSLPCPWINVCRPCGQMYQIQANNSPAD